MENKDGEDQPIYFSYGFFYRSLQDYHGILEDLLEILLFEYLLAMSEYYLKRGSKDFWHSYAIIQEDTRIAPNTARKIVKKLVATGLVTTEVRYINRSRTTCFTMQYMEIVRKAGAIWQIPSAKDSPAQFARVKMRKSALIQMFKLFTSLKKK